MANMPMAAFDITPGLVRSLVLDQRPDLAGLSLVEVASGWDNATFRLGEELAIRMPRREEAVPLILHEQKYVPQIAARCPTFVPVPVHAGQPGPGFPWPWSIVRWVHGTAAADVAPSRRGPAAAGLVRFLSCLHVPASEQVPVNVLRGVPLADRSGAVLNRLADTIRYPEAGRLLRLWGAACGARQWDGPPLMLHGDLHPGNILLTSNGSLAGVIDFGDVGAGDPAVDLAVGWLMFGGESRLRFRDALSPAPDGGTWTRARGWALVLATAMVSNSDDNPRMLSAGKFGISQVLQG